VRVWHALALALASRGSIQFSAITFFRSGLASCASTRPSPRTSPRVSHKQSHQHPNQHHQD